MTDVEQYKSHLSGIFTRASAHYDQAGPRFFTHFGQRLVESARISPGARVLDVACGRGAILFPALRTVGTSGEVVGIDISEGMIQEVSRDIARLGLGNATALKMDAESLEFPESSFDTVICGLVLFFLPNLERALAGFRRLLKPGGWLVASTFRQAEDEASKRWDALGESFKDSLKPAPKAETVKMNSQEEMGLSMDSKRSFLVASSFWNAGIEVGEFLGNAAVEFCQREEGVVPEGSQDPAFSDKDR